MLLGDFIRGRGYSLFDFPSRWGVFRKSQFAIWKMQISGDCHCSSKKYQNQGYGFKLLKEWCSWVHEVYGYSRLDILIDAENEPSIRLFRKLDVKWDSKDSDVLECHIELPL